MTPMTPMQRAPASVTVCTVRACASGASKRPMTPMPPSRSMAIAMSAPVTVSMLAERSGTARVIPGAMTVLRSTSLRERTRE